MYTSLIQLVGERAAPDVNRREFSFLLSGSFALPAMAVTSGPRGAEAARLRSYAEATHPRGWIAAADPAWRSGWDRLAAEADAMTPEAYLMGLMARLAWFHDGHTTMYVDGRAGPASMIKAPGFDLTLPIAATPFFDGLYVTAAKGEGASLLGARIARVDGVAIEEILRSFAAMWPGNNPTRAHHDADLILRPAVLRGARLAAPAGVSAPVTVEAELGGATVKAVMTPRKDTREGLVPLPRKPWPVETWRPGSASNFVHAEGRTLVIAFDRLFANKDVILAFVREAFARM